MYPGTLNSTDFEETSVCTAKAWGHALLYRDHIDMYLKHACQRTTFPIIIHEDASSESSASLRISDAALSSPDYPLQRTNLAGGLEQLEDSNRPMTPGAEVNFVAGDAALCKQLFTDLLKSRQQNQMILNSETLLIVEQFFTDLMWNQQQNQIILSLETLLIVEQLFADLLQVQQRKQHMQEIQRILS